MTAVPPGWSTALVSDLGVPNEQAVMTGPFGSHMRSSEFSSTGVPVLTIGCLTEAGISLEKASYLPEKKAEPLARYRLCEGDMLFSRMASVGRAGFVTADLEGALFNYHLMRLRLDSSVYHPQLFLAFVRGAPQVRTYLDDVNHGATRDGINTEQLLRMPVLVPPVNEQGRIVAKLDAIFDQTRAAKVRLERLPALLKKLKRSILAAAFRGDLTKDWRAAHPDVEPADVLLDGVRKRRCEGWGDQRKAIHINDEVQGLFELPSTWRWQRFDQLATSLRGGTSTRAENTESPWPILRSSAVRHGEIDFDDVRYLPSVEPETDADLVRKGDLLFTRLSGTLEYVGNCAIVREPPARPTYYPDRIFRAQVDDAVSAEFVELAFSVRLLRGALENSAKSTAGHQRISLSDLREFILPIPPRDEQKEISRLTNAALREIAGIRLHIEQAQGLSTRCEQAGLAKAFRGELVPQDPTEEPASVLLDRIRAARAAKPEQPQRGRGQRGDHTTMTETPPMLTGNGHAANGHHDDSLDLVIAIFQSERRLTATAIAKATGLDTSAVKKALKSLVEAGQVRVEGTTRSTAYEWTV